MQKKHSFFGSDRIFDWFNYLIMIIIAIIFIWPLWFVIIASVSDPDAVWAGEVILYPIEFTLSCYKRIFEYEQIWIGYRNTIFYTLVGTTLNVVMTILVAFPLSRKNLMFGGFFSKMFMITMYFSGGLIPNYLLVENLGLMNTPLALILPGAISFFNVIIVRTFFANTIPDSLEEAASIDGANTWTYFLKVVLPLSKAIIAIMVLYYAVGHWNSYFNAMIYINDVELQPLQLVLRNILINDSTVDMMESMDMTEQIERMRIAQSMKYGIIIVSAAPLLCIYPFVQKYFVKGVMIGAVKG